MKLLLILVGFFACMSVERVGLRKWSVVFRPGILFLLVMVALGFAGCTQNENGRRYSTDDATGCTFWVNTPDSISPRMGADGKQICRKPTP